MKQTKTAASNTTVKNQTYFESPSLVAEREIDGDDDGDDNNGDNKANDDDTDHFEVTEYLEAANNFDLKFCRIRLVNGILFVVGFAFYVSMDSTWYSGIDGSNVIDDDTIQHKTDDWINSYGILYFLAASFFVVTALMDLMLVRLGTSSADGILRSEEVQQQIIIREQARIRSKTKRQQSTMMGMPIKTKVKNDERQQLHVVILPVDNDNDDGYDDGDGDDGSNNDRKRNDIASYFVEQGSEYFGRCNKNCCSMVLVISWTLLLAGLFGVVSSVLVVKHTVVSDVMNLISVHLFFVQACAMVYARLSSKSRGNDDDGNHDNDDGCDDDGILMIILSKWILIIGDFSFFSGASIDLVMSYIYLKDMYTSAYFNEAVATLVSGMLWLLCSVFYLIVAIYDYRVLTRDIAEERISFETETKSQQKQ